MPCPCSLPPSAGVTGWGPEGWARRPCPGRPSVQQGPSEAPGMPLPPSLAVFPALPSSRPRTARPAPTPRSLWIPAGCFSAQGTSCSQEGGGHGGWGLQDRPAPSQPSPSRGSSSRLARGCVCRDPGWPPRGLHLSAEHPDPWGPLCPTGPGERGFARSHLLLAALGVGVWMAAAQGHPRCRRPRQEAPPTPQDQGLGLLRSPGLRRGCLGPWGSPWPRHVDQEPFQKPPDRIWWDSRPPLGGAWGLSCRLGVGPAKSSRALSVSPLRLQTHSS